MKQLTAITIFAASALCAGMLVTTEAVAQGGPDRGARPEFPGHWQPGRHWGWLNGHDASGGEGWIDDSGNRFRSTSRDERRAVLPGYHWGWLNGRDASGGAGWLDDRTGLPMNGRRGDERRDARFR